MMVLARFEESKAFAKSLVAAAMLLAVAGVGVGSDGESPTTIVSAQASMELRGTAPPCCTGMFHTCSCHAAEEPTVTTVPVPTSLSCAFERTVETRPVHGERSRVFRPPRAQLAPSTQEFEIG